MNVKQKILWKIGIVESHYFYRTDGKTEYSWPIIERIIRKITFPLRHPTLFLFYPWFPKVWGRVKYYWNAYYCAWIYIKNPKDYIIIDKADYFKYFFPYPKKHDGLQ